MTDYSNNDIKTIETSELTLAYIGPTLDIPAKTIFYFSLGAKDTLESLPFAYPALQLATKGFRVLTATLPLHKNEERPLDIQKGWSEIPDEVDSYIDRFKASVDQVEELEGPFAAMGLSRGGFIAMHLATRMPNLDTVVAFAPIVRLPDVERLDLHPLAGKLSEKKLRFFVGHKDELIKTEFVQELYYSILSQVEKKDMLSKQIHLVLSPSTGHKGHGTPNAIFDEGVAWIVKNL